jgi:hypothetical protein
MLASNGDDGTMTGCGDGEQRVWRRPVEVGGGESVWVGLRSGYMKQDACSCTSRQQLRFLTGGRR